MIRLLPQAFNRCLLLIVSLLLFILPTNSCSKSLDPQFDQESLSQMSSDFNRLRKIKGHFSGGSWNNAVDKWRGYKHNIMLKFSKHFDRGGQQVSRVIQYMGSPDETAEPGSRLFQQLNTLPQYTGMDLTDSRFLIYYWRGEHDFLFFELRDEELLSTGWWHAGE